MKMPVELPSGREIVFFSFEMFHCNSDYIQSSDEGNENKPARISWSVHFRN